MAKIVKHIERHKDGSVWAKGNLVGGKQDGPWAWFRSDGTKMRSGAYKNGKQIGEWITYDKYGEVYKVTFLDTKNAKEVAAYYKAVPKAATAQLSSLRKIVKQAIKGSDEVIKYAIPHVRHKGKPIVGIAGFNGHVSLFPLGGGQIKKYAAELKDFKTSRGTIQFPLSTKLPEALIKRIIKDRLMEAFSN